MPYKDPRCCGIDPGSCGECRLDMPAAARPKDVSDLHSVLIEGHISIAIAIFVLLVSPPKPTSRVVNVTRKARECEAISLVPFRHAIQELFVRAKTRGSD
jgi:uncharacterized protein (DUF983 family)